MPTVLSNAQFLSLLALVFILVAATMVVGNRCSLLQVHRELNAINSIMLAFAALLITLQLCRASSTAVGRLQERYTDASSAPAAPDSAEAAFPILPGPADPTADQTTDPTNLSLAAFLEKDQSSSTKELQMPPAAQISGQTIGQTLGQTLGQNLGQSSGLQDDVERVDANETLPLKSAMTTGLTMYTSCFHPASYTSPETSGRTWRSVRSASMGPGPGPSVCAADGRMRSLDLQFKNTPAFSKKDGFALGQNTLTGPLSYLLGINGDMAFSVMLVCQFTGDSPVVSSGRKSSPNNSVNDTSVSIGSDNDTNNNNSNTNSTDFTNYDSMDNNSTVNDNNNSAVNSEEASVFKIFANTISNNGISLAMRAGSPVPNMVAAQCVLRLGKGLEVPCTLKNSTNILFQPRRPYLLAIVKDYGRLQVHCVDLGNASEYRKEVLMDYSAGTMEPITFSNMDMSINESGNLGANILTFSIFARALSDSDLTAWHKHYTDTLKQFDASYRDMSETLRLAKAASSCSFDPSTCAACGGVKDWSNMSNILLAGPACLTAIDKYCTANPSSARCECWNLNNPAYATTCLPLRAAFAGTQVVPKAALETARAQARAEACPSSSAEPHIKPPDAQTSGGSLDALVKTLVTPENIVAVGKAISQVQSLSGGGHHNHKHRRHNHAQSCCCHKCQPHKQACPNNNNKNSNKIHKSGKSEKSDKTEDEEMNDVDGDDEDLLAPPVSSAKTLMSSLGTTGKSSGGGFFGWMFGK